MSATNAAILQQIVVTIKRFKFEEMESAVMPVFPEISWSDIKTEFIRCHKRFTPTNTALFIRIAIAEANLRKKELMDRLSTLKLIDISWHSTRCIWYGYGLTGSNKPVNYLVNRDFQRNVQDYLQSLNIKMDVKVNVHDGITYISLTDSRKKPIRGLPITFALFVGQKHFFCTKRNIPSNIMKAITKNLGFENIKRLKLTGKDLKSLSRLCWLKKEGALTSENVHTPLVYKDADPIERSTGIDFSQSRQRKEFARKCFGDDPPKLESLVVRGPNLPLAHEDISEKLPDEGISLTWKFRSRNIAEFLVNLIERRILVTPVPDYITNLMTLGKNELTLQSV